MMPMPVSAAAASRTSLALGRTPSTAHFGIAMGAAGTDTAMKAADDVVMNDDLPRIATMVKLSRSTHAVL
jgi:hypothetical protein